MEVTREIELDEEPGEVWEALTEPERLEEWFAPEVELDARPGGLGVFRWGNGEERHAIVEEVDPERRLALRFDDDGVVELLLEPVPEGHARRRHGERPELRRPRWSCAPWPHARSA